MTNLRILTLKEKEEMETKFDKALRIILCFLDRARKEIAPRGSLAAKNVWDNLQAVSIIVKLNIT